jgi:hypothetical protein
MSFGASRESAGFFVSTNNSATDLRPIHSPPRCV